MRIGLFLCIVAGVLSGASATVVVSQPKYGVTVKTVNQAALTKARTYAWRVSKPSFDKTIDALIVAAVDRELAAHGLTKLTSGQSDVDVTYGSLSRTDVDLKKGGKDGARPESAVGTLVVDLTDPTSRKELFSVRMDTPIASDPATLEATINAAVTAMFEKYPSPSKR
jgi:Domain of unknown function (DUF4136)